MLSVEKFVSQKKIYVFCSDIDAPSISKENIVERGKLKQNSIRSQSCFLVIVLKRNLCLWGKLTRKIFLLIIC